MKVRFKEFGSKILDVLFPKHIKCIFCGEELNEKSVYDTCEVCQRTLPFITRPCARCGIQIEESYSNVCFACNKTNREFVQAKSVFDYTDKVVALVHKFKYNAKRYFAEPMVQYMAEVFGTWGIMPDIVCDVPMHKNKLKERGKNHGTILANLFADMFSLNYLPLCEKVVDNKSQASLSFSERRENIKGVYAVNKEYIKEINGKSILIVDDVITTCSTINEISKVLTEHGAAEVYAISFAHTNTNVEK